MIKRMEDRQFNEVDLRAMLQHACSYRKNIVESRWVIGTRYKEQAWEIIVEPDVISRLLVVVTAYPVWND
ncbi:MAG TPA: hypothetical protein P5102_07070 [Candidatus Competibacteraceae bacterium]|nr:hypothetical protein [Candidatus Competibacteraceae bacterium]HRZ05897.1 hypothetical protein [Candidatus Competibacteraceae bacterium]HSA46358.1 hypothetical protein [Candidatus Competibacteraceae bacterium]